MVKKHIFRLMAAVFCCGVLLFGLTSCGSDSGGADNEIYGNGFKDVSDVIAKVGDITITRSDLELRYGELPPKLKRRYSGDDWEARFLRFMIDEALLYEGARSAEIQLDPTISQALISQKRYVMADGFRRLEVWKDLEPTEQQIRDYYEDFPEDFVVHETVKARHIECATEQDARKAWEALHAGGQHAKFPYVVSEYSVNAESAKLGGDLGWFNKGGYIGAIPNSKQFIDAVWDLDTGLNEPVKIGKTWHIVEILSRKPARPLTLAEARPQIVKDLEPMVRNQRVDEYLTESRETYPIEYFGDFRPGSGSSPEAFFKRALANKDPQVQLDLYGILIEDYPENEYKPKALFMAANLQMDRYQDRFQASRLLNRLIAEYPDNELVDQARFLLDNMGRRGSVVPENLIEDE